MKVTFNQHIGIFKNAIDNEWCDQVIEIFDQNHHLHRSRQETENDVLSIYKADHSLEFIHYKKIGKEDIPEHFHKIFGNNILPLYNKKYEFKEEDTDVKYIISDFKTQKTLPSEGYHVWHYENAGANLTYSSRLLAWTLYLNDVEEGGETEFLHQSIRVKPEKGTIAVWPAGFTHYHRGNPPISGKKYIATGWLNWLPKDSELSIHYNE